MLRKTILLHPGPPHCVGVDVVGGAVVGGAVVGGAVVGGVVGGPGGP